MGIADIFKEIADGLTAFAPAFGKSIWTLFCNIFLEFTTTEAGAITITGFNILGTLSIVSLVMGITYKTVPMVVNWISKKSAARRRRKAKA